MDGICYIVGSRPPGEIVLAAGREALVIAADGGLRHLEDQGLRPDLIVGDFDSLGRAPQGDNVLRHPVEKDDTDMLLAVRTGLDRGYGAFVLYGGLGGRLDHTLANLQTLHFLAGRGASGWLLGEGMAVTAVSGGGALSFGPERRGIVSVFCAGPDAEGVCLEGLHYPLSNAVLTSAFPLGVSNQFTGRPARISLERGTLLVMWEESAASVVSRLASSSS